MKKCPVCGTELPDTARFCSHCGHTLSTPAPIDRSANMRESSAADVRPTNISIAPTLPLTNNDEKEQAQTSIFPGVKWLIAAIIALVLIAGSLGTLFVFLSSHSSRTGGTPKAATTAISNSGVTPNASVCSSLTGATSSSCSTAAISPTPIVSSGMVDLTFSGAVIGHMTAPNVVTCGPGSSVAGGTQYQVAIFGAVGGQQYALTFGVYPYTGSNTYTSSVFSFFGPAGDNSSIVKWRSSPNLRASVTINSDGKTGNLDIGYLSSSDKSTARVSGSWKCD